MSVEDEHWGAVYSINYNHSGVLGPTNNEVGKFRIQPDGDIKVELFSVPGSGQMLLRGARVKLPE
jgi:hypothetical protein